MKKVLLMAAVAFAFAACGNSNSNKKADCCETKATEHVCNHGEGHKCTKAEGEHKCNHAAADSTKHECNHENGECNQPAEKQCDKCKEAAAKKAAEQAK